MNILVTGGSSGLGKAIVETLSEKGHKVYFTYCRNAESAMALEKRFPGSVAVFCEFGSRESVDALAASLQDYSLNVLVNNAYSGSSEGMHFHKMPAEQFLENFRDNIVPLIKITQAALSGFKAQKFGKIINVLSAYLIGLPPSGFSAYTANKAYLQQLSKCWNSEYARYNITSNCVSPEFMVTNFTSHVDKRILEQMVAAHPLGRLLSPVEAAGAVAYLVDSSQYVNGVNIVINSGKNPL